MDHNIYLSIYLSIYLLVLIGIGFDIFNIKYKNYIFIFNFLVVYVFSSIRYSIGVDYFNYEVIFENALPLNKISFLDLYYEKHNLELGYLFLQSLIRVFTKDFYIFVIIYNTLIFYFLYKGIIYFKNRNVQLFFIICFIFVNYINTAYRSALIMAIFYYNLRHIIHRDLFKYILFCLLGALFHISSLMYLPLYFVGQIKPKVIIIISAFLAFLGFIDLMPYFVNLLYEIFPSVRFIGRVSYYIKTEQISIGLSYLIFKLGLLTIILLNYHKLKKQMLILNITILCFAIELLFMNNMLLAGRFSDSLLVSVGICFSFILYKVDIRKRLDLYTSIMFIIFSSFYYYASLFITHPEKGYLSFQPYLTIFSSEEEKQQIRILKKEWIIEKEKSFI